jgi:hypothetical protein
MKVPLPFPLPLTTHAEDVTTLLAVPAGWKPDTEQVVSVNGTGFGFPIVNFTSLPGGPEVGVRTSEKPTPLTFTIAVSAETNSVMRTISNVAASLMRRRALKSKHTSLKIVEIAVFDDI